MSGDEDVAVGVALQQFRDTRDLDKFRGLQSCRIGLELDVLDADGDALVGGGDADVGQVGDGLFDLSLE